MGKQVLVGFVAIVTLLVLSGCQDEAEPTAVPKATETTDSLAAEATAQAAEAEAEAEAEAKVDLVAMIEGADVDRGKRLFLQCQACHGLEEGEAHKVGPNLHGFMSRKVGEAEGFNYSAALVDADFEWSAAQLNEWLATPSQFLPGNRMAFVGVSDAQDRANLIAYLKTASQ